MPHLINLVKPIAIKDGDSIRQADTLIGEVGRNYPNSGTTWTVTDIVLDNNRIRLSNPAQVTIAHSTKMSSQYFSE